MASFGNGAIPAACRAVCHACHTAFLSLRSDLSHAMHALALAPLSRINAPVVSAVCGGPCRGSTTSADAAIVLMVTAAIKAALIGDLCFDILCN